MDDPVIDATPDYTTSQLTLDMKRIANNRRLKLGRFTSESMTVEATRDVMMNDLILSVEAYVLTDHLGGDTHFVTWAEPATWWDHLKETLLRRWRRSRRDRRWWQRPAGAFWDWVFAKHYPRYVTNHRVVRLHTDVHYPQAEVPFRPDYLGRGYPFQWWTVEGLTGDPHVQGGRSTP